MSLNKISPSANRQKEVEVGALQDRSTTRC
ncbi:hypothetical protein MPTK1_3g22340 [Marchantia polymorpha subsp. ruderalis]|uniref:Uncharacterized protein n=2 Tax=Marchantia polymorpha TaxID=3197 RepID=A0AAF6B3J2_MARPO|nr:hypothetical protein MARPO_0024s0012 [Marchantia polymorpha]BBN06576.1 hypothetical protein Mp_3g22340 [Marchantia polymorpha subsp. ruderalis]|eukprot:PTQ43476.1 hypothetical protein MARPO_0024s0012 [Marchantia polymorpha]